eukprot:2578702-Rhodomonas_salina.1
MAALIAFTTRRSDVSHLRYTGPVQASRHGTLQAPRHAIRYTSGPAECARVTCHTFRGCGHVTRGPWRGKRHTLKRHAPILKRHALTV